VAEELRTAFAVETELIPGKDGIFDVTVDGSLIYSKDQTGRFPNPDEISALIKK
jgi:selT/selW/selH-like putative selenoprotein